MGPCNFDQDEIEQIISKDNGCGMPDWWKFGFGLKCDMLEAFIKKKFKPDVEYDESLLISVEDSAKD